MTVGDRTEARVLAALIDHFDTILMPFGSNCRYDMAVGLGKSIIRIQCKTARLRKGVVRFSTTSSMAHHRSGGRRGYQDQADYFGSYCPNTDQVYLVPVSEAGDVECWLRVDPPLNNQVAGIKWAKSYLLSEVAPGLTS